jgi:hypothetical protein
MSEFNDSMGNPNVETDYQKLLDYANNPAPEVVKEDGAQAEDS